MKKCILLISLLIFFLLPQGVFAHMPGQLPYFMINGKYSNTYLPPPNTYVNQDPPQDLAPEKYHQNQPLHFKIDTAKFPQATPDQIRNTKFSWTFGDGNKAEGLENTYSYKKPGTYILTIMADDGTTPTPQLFESVLMTINPNQKSSSHNDSHASNLTVYIAGGLIVAIVLIFGAVLFLKR